MTLRLLYFDNEKEDAARKMLAYEVCKMLMGTESGDSDVEMI